MIRQHCNGFAGIKRYTAALMGEWGGPRIEGNADRRLIYPSFILPIYNLKGGCVIKKDQFDRLASPFVKHKRLSKEEGPLEKDEY